MNFVPIILGKKEIVERVIVIEEKRYVRWNLPYFGIGR